MFKSFTDRGLGLLGQISPKALDFVMKRARVVKYLIAGGTAASVDIGFLYVFKGIIGLSLIPAVSFSFLIAFWVSFLLQKFWTFGDNTVDRVHTQALFYFIVCAVNFCLNLLFMYFLVEKVHVWYILAKIIVSGAIAFSSFFIYRIFIFKQ